eukprot:TRINITY_DN7913_c0_g2_i1.p1 TRINITY_DN7913_c0_g2~~TRINITY_DN7913_c0_g2_i1.p1  ORF type:complete len:545 (-),score=123.03 TRINITY_DN7913_c0_g2_i1:45-1679(-)
MIKFRNLKVDLESHLAEKSVPPQWLLPKECQYLSPKVYPFEIIDHPERHLTVTQPITFDVDVSFTSPSVSSSSGNVTDPVPSIPLSRASSTESVGAASGGGGPPRPFVRQGSLNRPGLYQPPVRGTVSRMQPPKKIQTLSADEQASFHQPVRKTTPKHVDEEAKRKLEEKQKAKNLEKQEKQRKKEEERASKKQKTATGVVERGTKESTPPTAATAAPDFAMPNLLPNLLPPAGLPTSLPPVQNMAAMSANQHSQVPDLPDPGQYEPSQENPQPMDYEMSNPVEPAQPNQSSQESQQQQLAQMMQGQHGMMNQMANFPFHHQMAALPEAAQVAAQAAVQYMSSQPPAHWNFQPNPLMQASQDGMQPHFNFSAAAAAAAAQAMHPSMMQGMPMHFNPAQLPMPNQLSVQQQQQAQQQAQAHQQQHHAMSQGVPSQSSQLPHMQSPGQHQQHLTQEQLNAQERIHQQLQSIVADANALASEDRALIERFLLGQEIRPPNSEPQKVVLSENLVTGEDGLIYKDIILFEMNFDRGSWRKLKKRKKARN